MAVIEGTNTIAGAMYPLQGAGAPVAGTTEIQTLTLGGTITGGTFAVNSGGMRTAPITWSATNATLIANIDAALEALPSIGTGGVTTAAGSLTAGIGTITLTFDGAANALKPQPLLVADGSLLTGTAPTAAIASTTPGVFATHRNASKSQLYQDTTNGNLYQNTGVPGAPTWTQIS